MNSFKEIMGFAAKELRKLILVEVDYQLSIFLTLKANLK